MMAITKWFNGIGQDGTESDEKPAKYKTDRQILELILSKVEELDDRLSALEEQFCDENGRAKELTELKNAHNEQSKFMQSMVMTLIEGKNNKPSAVELYMQQKREREEKEAAAKQRSGGRLS
jgi:hypothetical protein